MLSLIEFTSLCITYTVDTRGSALEFYVLLGIPEHIDPFYSSRCAVLPS